MRELPQKTPINYNKKCEKPRINGAKQHFVRVDPGFTIGKNNRKCELFHRNEPLNTTKSAKYPLKTTFSANLSSIYYQKKQQKVRGLPWKSQHLVR